MARAELDYDFVVVDPEEVTSPRTVGFIEQCRQIQGDRPFPRWSDFKLYELPSKVIPYATVADVGPGPADFIYRFWGTGHTSLKGVDLTGRRVDAIPAAALARIGVRQFQLVCEERRPLVFVHTLRAYGP